MKVFVLINTYDESIDGTYTLEGKREKEQEFLANALKAKEAHIDEMHAALLGLKERFDFINFQANKLAECCIFPRATRDPNYDKNCSRYEELQEERAKIAEQVTKLTLRISQVTAFSTADIMKHYSVGYRWEEHELQGN
jgi:hypothetical protein